MTAPAILALDCATTTGWAIAEPDAVCAWPATAGVRYGAHKLLRERGNRGSLFYNFRRWLNSLLCVYRIGAVAVEEASCIRGRNARMLLIPLVGIVEETCWEREIPAPIIIPPMSAKKSFTGHGNATKGVMRARARQLGFGEVGEDAADALALLGVACEVLRKGLKQEDAASDLPTLPQRPRQPAAGGNYTRERDIDGSGCDMGPPTARIISL